MLKMRFLAQRVRAARHGASNVRELITWEITRVLVCNPVITTGLVIWTDHDARDVFY